MWPGSRPGCAMSDKQHSEYCNMCSCILNCGVIIEKYSTNVVFDQTVKDIHISAI